jgi:predicted HTH transcriptional regulator
MKSVAAFANGQGGTLLVGVADDGMPLGLEKDYMSLSGDRDRFELHVRNLFNQSFGHSFVASKLHISFPMVQGAEICQIDIEPAVQPIILNLTDKSGQKIEKFYVRSGNSSQDMPLSEIHSYFEDRFS